MRSKHAETVERLSPGAKQAVRALEAFSQITFGALMELKDAGLVSPDWDHRRWFHWLNDDGRAVAATLSEVTE